MESTTELELRREEIQSLNNWLLLLLKEGAGPEDKVEPNDTGITISYSDVDIIRVLTTVDEALGKAFGESFRQNRLMSNFIWQHVYRNQPELIVVAVKHGGFAYVQDFINPD